MWLVWWLACKTTAPDAVSPPAGVPLAVTIDDLPFAGPGDARAGLAQIVAALTAHDVPATGFVTCGERDLDLELAPWSGLAVGNHSRSHRSVDDLGRQAFVADIAACRTALAAVGHDARFVRYPYLMTGADRSLRDGVATDLEALGLLRAPVTIDTSDWVAAAAYAEYGDVARDAWLAHIRRAARHYREVARRRVGREVAQVLLLHANQLTADHLSSLLVALRDDGFRFVSLDEALDDPVYAKADDWVDPVGASWLLRIEPADRVGWGWDVGQQRAMQARFGAREEPPGQRLRIGPHLEAVRLDDVPAWRITDTETVPANSLLVQTPEGSTVLADTPFTPRATRDLLDWIEARFGAPPTLATVSHFHFDASAGIDVLREAAIPVMVSDRSMSLLAERGASMMGSLAEMHGAPFEGWSVPTTEATFALEEGHRTVVGGTAVEVLFPGHGHAPDNVVTWFPDLGVLFGGCMVKGGDDLGYLGHANVATWPDAMRRLEALKPRLVVPGHGRGTDPAMLAHTREMAEAASP